MVADRGRKEVGNKGTAGESLDLESLVGAGLHGEVGIKAGGGAVGAGPPML